MVARFACLGGRIASQPQGPVESERAKGIHVVGREGDLLAQHALKAAQGLCKLNRSQDLHTATRIWTHDFTPFPIDCAPLGETAIDLPPAPAAQLGDLRVGVAEAEQDQRLALVGLQPCDQLCHMGCLLGALEQLVRAAFLLANKSYRVLCISNSPGIVCIRGSPGVRVRLAV